MYVRIYGDPESREVEEFQAQVELRWDELQLSTDALQIEHWPIGHTLQGDPPSVDIHVHFDSDSSALGELRRAIDAEETFFAVVADAPAAAGLPTPLAKLNAFLQARYRDYWKEALVDELLTRAVLPRRTPRVFISYRRDDSENVAAQLHAEFTRLGFLVFLDTVSIGVAEDFQKELMWWLNDADLLVLLASPRLEQSDWVRKEVEFAKSTSVGMQIVRWPAPCFATKGKGKVTRPFVGDVLDSSMFCDLDVEDLGMDGLSDAQIRGTFAQKAKALHSLESAALGRVVAQALSLRARAVHERRLDLLGYVHRREQRSDSKPKYGALPGDLIVDRNGVPHLIRVFPFRPEPVMLGRTAKAVSTGETSSAEYRENYPHDERATALKWLADRRGFSLHPVTGGWR